MRSTTPPLYYKRPEAAPVPYYIAGSTRDIPPSLRVPQPTTGAATATTTSRWSNAMPAGNPRVGSVDQSTYGPPPTQQQQQQQQCSSNTFIPVPSVANPFGIPNTSPRNSLVGENPSELLQQSAVRWSTTANQSAQALSSLETEEATLLLEEQTMRAKLAELQLTRQRQSEEQLNLSQGWATMLDREERYFMEPPLDLSEEIWAREQQCALLQQELQQAETQLEELRQEHEEYNAVMQEKQELEKEMQRLRESFMAIEERRKACRSLAERCFDAESKRAVVGARYVRELETQLKEMTSSGPLAETQNVPPSRSTSRGVTFAQKSIILDLGPQSGKDYGGRKVDTDENDNDNNTEGGEAGLTQGIGGTSVCLQDDEDDDDDNDYALGGGIGGQSAAYSLSLLKRTRVEVPTA
ncbi:uncharacterized protein TM35_000441590 [Trypanosoma theileri]|uniref:Kinetoplastid kinetochore protein 8 n=1 Tax=Trypanosoma theileri TaxID=67003 RepID=A0A1X0NJ59_9TRYP|nr:uncharacterized protein TM35_000441590 [Trypanosoma theileri]ORC84503.1 hypothetical protein TM35_000441590 [Trypanosoma theileri]